MDIGKFDWQETHPSTEVSTLGTENLKRVLGTKFLRLPIAISPFQIHFCCGTLALLPFSIFPLTFFTLIESEDVRQQCSGYLFNHFLREAAVVYQFILFASHRDTFPGRLIPAPVLLLPKTYRNGFHLLECRTRHPKD